MQWRRRDNSPATASDFLLTTTPPIREEEDERRDERAYLSRNFREGETDGRNSFFWSLQHINTCRPNHPRKGAWLILHPRASILPDPNQTAPEASPVIKTGPLDLDQVAPIKHSKPSGQLAPWGPIQFYSASCTPLFTVYTPCVHILFLFVYFLMLFLLHFYFAAFHFILSVRISYFH